MVSSVSWHARDSTKPIALHVIIRMGKCFNARRYACLRNILPRFIYMSCVTGWPTVFGWSIGRWHAMIVEPPCPDPHPDLYPHLHPYFLTVTFTLTLASCRKTQPTMDWLLVRGGGIGERGEWGDGVWREGASTRCLGCPHPALCCCNMSWVSGRAGRLPSFL